jgi:hypothetical protein
MTSPAAAVHVAAISYSLDAIVTLADAQSD